MKTHFWQPIKPVLRALTALCLGAGLAPVIQAAIIPPPTAEDFGYGAWKPFTNRYPTLVVLVDFGDGGPGLNFDTNTWGRFIFNGSQTPSVNGYYNEVSKRQFALAEARTMRMTVPHNWRITNFSALYPNDGATADLVYHSLMMSNAMRILGNGFFAQYDRNSNNWVETSELYVLFLMHEEEAGGARPAQARPPGFTFGFSGAVVGADGDFVNGPNQNYVSFFCHELTHLMGASDLYGIWGGGEQRLNHNLSLMSVTALCHLDAWHKMMFGWVKPRLYPMTDSGQASIPAATSSSTNAPILLYRNAILTREFFMLEYRKTNTLYESQAAGDGMVLWQIHQEANHSWSRYIDVIQPAPVQNWYLCGKCMSFVDTDTNRTKYCTLTNGMHADVHAVDRAGFVPASTGAPGETEWRSCTKCGCIYYHPNVASSRCTHGGTHSGGTEVYVVKKNVPDLMGLHYCRRCTRCQQLVLATVDNLEVGCPAWTVTNSPIFHSYDTNLYTVPVTWNQLAIEALAAPDLFMGSNRVWTADMLTPELVGYDAVQLGTRIYVHPFDPNTTTSISVEWGRTDSWVDFAFIGTELGTFAQPFDTVAEGVSEVIRTGTVHLKPGVSAETIRITKPLRLEHYGSPDTPTTIGR